MVHELIYLKFVFQVRQDSMVYLMMHHVELDCYVKLLVYQLELSNKQNLIISVEFIRLQELELLKIGKLQY